MQVALEDVLKEYREHNKFNTDDLLMHKAALKSAEKQIAELNAEIERLKEQLDT